MAVIFWMVLFVICLIVEAACPIHLVSIWFAVGSLIAALVANFGGPGWLQIGAFLVVSAGLLLALWPFTKKFLNPGRTKTNVDAVIGQQCYVTADINNVEAHGQVKLNGMEWSARSTSGENIPAGTLVKVDKVEGVKVFVTAVKVPV